MDGLAGGGMRLSVVVPARNEERGLEECLESLVRQSEVGFALGREWELIVVDDASTDGTRGIAERVAAGFSGEATGWIDATEARGARVERGAPGWR